MFPANITSTEIQSGATVQKGVLIHIVLIMHFHILLTFTIGRVAICGRETAYQRLSLRGAYITGKNPPKTLTGPVIAFSGS